MKNISADLQAHLDSGATTLCWCWKIVRNDAVTQGFTDHDVNVIFDGVVYEAASGFTASEVQSSLGLAVDNLTVTGALNSATINESDLAAGLYDDASIEIWRVNWQTPAQRVLMRKGSLGEVQRGRTGFQAEVRGLAHILNQPVGRAFGYSCDADLGDARCTVSLATPTFTGNGIVASVPGGFGASGFVSNGGAGSQYDIWTDNSGGPHNGNTAGPGSGGGGAGGTVTGDTSAKRGGDGGGFGGGGGGGPRGTPPGTGGAGAPGIIVITYTPGSVTAVSHSFGSIIA